ncbi:unnamed protein product [Symbiodinium sp. CCMP2592]|nr:unnamed protein product [Symbiodinium sp. CCMP2592]
MYVPSSACCFNLFLRRENSTSLIHIDAGITIGQILQIATFVSPDIYEEVPGELGQSLKTHGRYNKFISPVLVSHSLGVDEARVLTTTITVRDVIQDTEECEQLLISNGWRCLLKSGLLMLLVQIGPHSVTCVEESKFLLNIAMRFTNVLDAHIQKARETVFPGDDRFSAFNIAAKCVIPYKVLGFPAGTSMKDVVKTLETLGFVAVPSRIVNLRELAVVFLAAPQPPSANRFQTSAGVIQIIEVERKTFNRKENSMIAPIPPSSSRTPNNHKGYVKGSGKGGRDGLSGPLLSERALMFPKPAVPLLPNPFADRVDALETQVATLKQDIEAEKKDGADTKQQLPEISSNQNRGFQELLTAISEIRANMSSAANSSQQNHSPPSKQSPPNKHPRL